MIGIIFTVAKGDLPHFMERLGGCMASLNAPRSEWTRLFGEPTQKKLNCFLAEMVELPDGSLGERAVGVAIPRRGFCVMENVLHNTENYDLQVETPGGVIITVHQRGNNDEGDAVYSVTLDFGRASKVLAEQILSVAVGVTENGYRLLEQAVAIEKFDEEEKSYLAEILKPALEERGLEIVEDLGSFRVQFFTGEEGLVSETFLSSVLFGEAYGLLEKDTTSSAMELVTKLENL